YAICVVFFVPASILTLGAGAIFGLVPGTLVVIAGATLGATLAFILARTVMRRRIEKMTEGNAKFAALDKAIAREGAKIVLLVRLSPLFPFTYINYAFGLTGEPRHVRADDAHRRRAGDVRVRLHRLDRARGGDGQPRAAD